jgi:glycerate kinase
MKILIATDSFKDCLPSKKVAEYIRNGLNKSSVGFNIKIIPMADGGEGTVEAIVEATGGKYFVVQVLDPLMRRITAKYGVTGDGKTAIIEMAAASGFELLKPNERNPWNTSTFGTGELILDALDKGYRRIIIGIGGSATNDGGTGMASAFGVKFYDSHNQILIPTGGSISELAKVDISGIDKRVEETEIIIASDVKNPLTGPEGASFVYARQKGADSEMIRKLEKNLVQYTEIVKNQVGIDIENVPGGGAAGGLGAGLIAFCGASIQSGFDIVRQETNLDSLCSWADVVITGEGKLDNQTIYGKTPQGVALSAKKFNKKVIAVAGTLGDGYQALYDHGFDLMLSIQDKPLSLEKALIEAPKLLEKTGYLIGKILTLKI